MGRELPRNYLGTTSTMKPKKMEQNPGKRIPDVSNRLDIPLRLASVMDKAVGAVVGTETLGGDGHDMAWPWMSV